MIATTIFLLAVAIIAYLEARNDTDAINNGLPINHKDELIERCVAVFMGGLLTCLAFHAWEWRTLLWMPMAWGLFTPSFRWMLNRMRSKPWYYLSRSNCYDTAFLNLTGTVSNDNVIAAARLAYAGELAVLIASICLYCLT